MSGRRGFSIGNLPSGMFAQAWLVAPEVHFERWSQAVTSNMMDENATAAKTKTLIDRKVWPGTLIFERQE